MIDGIREQRSQIDLHPRDEVLDLLNDKITQVSGVIPDLIHRIALKALDDIKSCTTEEQLLSCIIEWSSQAAKQENPEVQFFMNAMGSILLRIEM